MVCWTLIEQLQWPNDYHGSAIFALYFATFDAEENDCHHFQLGIQYVVAPLATCMWWPRVEWSTVRKLSAKYWIDGRDYFLEESCHTVHYKNFIVNSLFYKDYVAYWSWKILWICNYENWFGVLFTVTSSQGYSTSLVDQTKKKICFVFLHFWMPRLLIIFPFSKTNIRFLNYYFCSLFF